MLGAALACAEGPTTPDAASILTQPTDQSAVEGATATFGVVAENATAFQWQLSATTGAPFSDLAGATNPSYTTPPTQLSHSGQRFRVTVSGASNTVTSAAVTLTVTPAPVPPAVSVQPADQVITAGGDATFSVTATGTSLSYQWQRSTDGGDTFGALAAATGPTLTRTAVPLSDNGHRFRVVVSNSLGTVTSSAALLTVNPPPSLPAFTAHPANQGVVAPASATFNVTVTGFPTPTLQWQVSPSVGAYSDIAGATNTSYTTPATTTGDDGNRYRVVATNGSGSVTSNAAVLTVTAPLQIATASPLPSGTLNTPYGVTLTATGGAPPYVWGVQAGSTLPAFLTLNSTTGALSGTPTAEGTYNVSVRVTDASSPQQAAEKTLTLAIQAPCDRGFGWTTVDGAPVGVQGTFCPQTVPATPGEPSTSGLVYTAWRETYPFGGGAYAEGISVDFHYVSGEVESVVFSLNDATSSVMRICIRGGNADYPACTGVTVNPGAKTVTFVNTALGRAASGGVYTLNGTLRW